MSAPSAVAVASIFVWLGMVLAISFLEAPLKFRAPGVTLQIGLGIGRLVFRALNAAELVLGLTALVALQFQPPPLRTMVAILVAVVVLGLQLVVVRPRLNRRSDAVLAGEEGPRSRGHYYYVGLELIKVIALLISGILLLAA
ncbi:MAG TPA: hypothetical protein VFB19_12360 [Mycobacterium sp.]|nr:hypothetical protein [Mycobacterium sp.]